MKNGRGNGQLSNFGKPILKIFYPDRQHIILYYYIKNPSLSAYVFENVSVEAQ